MIFIGRDFETAFANPRHKHDTKKTVARMVGTIYDPLGVLLPWKTGGNLLMKEIWSLHQELAEQRGISKSLARFAAKRARPFGTRNSRLIFKRRLTRGKKIS